ncbi:hypothetical protein [Legionella sp. km772]|uniref:hypothetical protein n=1 Tax=Legionella sp. km772 TaxID=2498111 RepID=UPI000F8E16EF|nr:hypothetical protein [Legionella sp. km772]RUR06992.1 hypothetical protein ELY15_12620 [Legionella sp. km772]
MNGSQRMKGLLKFLLMVTEMPEYSLTEKQLQLKNLDARIMSALEKFKQFSDEKSIHKRNILFALQQYLKDGNKVQLEAAKQANPRWDESSNPFGSRVKALVDEAISLEQKIRFLKPDGNRQPLRKKT